MVLAGPRQARADLVLEGVVHERDEAEKLALLATDPAPLERLEQMRHVRPDRAFRVAGARFPPRQPLEQRRFRGDAPFQFRFGLEAWNQIARVHRAMTLPGTAGGTSVNAVCDPGVAAPRDGHVQDLVIRHGGQLRAVLLDAGPIVDQDEVELVVAELRPLTLERDTCRLFQQHGIPATIGRARGLQGSIRGGDPLREPLGVLLCTPARTDQPADEQQEEQRENDDHDDRKR
jgi:hypothetical protein